MNEYVNVLQTIDSPSALTQEEGDLVYQKIIVAFEKGSRITIDFDGIESIISPFLNNCIGQLYGKYDTEKIKEYLDLKNFPKTKNSTLNVVISNAKRFYADPSGYKKIAKEVIEN